MKSTLTSFLAAGACAVAILSTPAHAQRVSTMAGGKFLQICSAPRGVPACDAYIAGMADSFALVQKLAAHTPADASMKLPICVPTATATAEIRGHVVSWLKGHPDRLQSHVGEDVYEALRTSYPCSN